MPSQILTADAMALVLKVPGDREFGFPFAGYQSQAAVFGIVVTQLFQTRDRHGTDTFVKIRREVVPSQLAFTRQYVLRAYPRWWCSITQFRDGSVFIASCYREPERPGWLNATRPISLTEEFIDFLSTECNCVFADEDAPDFEIDEPPQDQVLGLPSWYRGR